MARPVTVAPAGGEALPALVARPAGPHGGRRGDDVHGFGSLTEMARAAAHGGVAVGFYLFTILQAAWKLVRPGIFSIFPASLSL